MWHEVWARGVWCFMLDTHGTHYKSSSIRGPQAYRILGGPQVYRISGGSQALGSYQVVPRPTGYQVVPRPKGHIRWSPGLQDVMWCPGLQDIRWCPGLQDSDGAQAYRIQVVPRPTYNVTYCCRVFKNISSVA